MEPQSTPPASAALPDPPISESKRLRQVHLKELECLNLATQPLRTLKFFALAVVRWVQRPVFASGSWWLAFFMALALVIGPGIIAVTIVGPHQEHFQELIRYSRFFVWWLSLGVASSIGLGSGLHTFVLYLGPHIALFTMKAVKCGRVDLKSAPYDTVQWSVGPSWLGKNCSEYGAPSLSSQSGLQLPVGDILQQVQLEAVLWGIGTALGELPPYFISKAASASGKKVEAMEELNPASSDESLVPKLLKQMKLWLLSRKQYLNFFTILVLASVPNPLFDLAGIMCGQFGIPFWKFFTATIIGKAVVKTHIQSIFVIMSCNSQLLDLVENQLIWMLGFVPGSRSFLPGFISRVHGLKEKYMTATSPLSSDVKVNKLNVTFGSIWNTVVWFTLMNFVIKIINTTAQGFLREQQEKDIVTMTTSHASSPSMVGLSH